MVKALIKPKDKVLEVDVPDSAKAMLGLLGAMKAQEMPVKNREKRLKELSDLSLERPLTDREYAEMRTLFAHKVGEKKSEELLGDKVILPIERKKLSRVI